MLHSNTTSEQVSIPNSEPLAWSSFCARYARRPVADQIYPTSFLLGCNAWGVELIYIRSVFEGIAAYKSFLAGLGKTTAYRHQAGLPILGLEHHFKLTGWCFVGSIWFQNLPCPASLFMLTFLGDPRSSLTWPHCGMLWLILMHKMFPQNNKMLLEAKYTVKLFNVEILGASWKIQSHIQNAVSASMILVRILYIYTHIIVPCMYL